MYKKNFRSNDRNRNKHDKWEDKQFVPSTSERPPSDDGSGNVATTINMKAMKNLPMSSYAMKVDPYTEANNPATPYQLLTRFNKVMGGSYKGDSNLDGGNLMQYNSAINSKFLKAYDTVLAKIGLNYRYLPIDPEDNKRGKDMTDEMIKAISEIVSSLNATTFKDQNIFYYGVETDMPMGSHTPETFTVNGVEKHIYTKLEEVLYIMCVNYQIYMQDIASVFNMFNANRSRMGTMVRMSWNREVPILNSFFGLLKKKSFLSLFDSLALNLAGEYLDTDWMAQVNTIQMVASRRSNALTDPIKEIAGYHNHPGYMRVYLFNGLVKTDDNIVPTPIFNSDNLAWTIAGLSEPVTFEEAITELSELLTLNDTLEWARSSNPNGENIRFNTIKSYLDIITYAMTEFKACFTDLRTVLTIMARLGVVNWSLGTKLSITQDTDCELTNYLVVDNLISEALSGARDVTFNNVTKRWRTFSLWNIYFGVPEYVTKSGGIFLSLSVKNKVVPTEALNDSNIGYLPVAYSLKTFGSTNAFVRAVSRDGHTALIGQLSSGVNIHDTKFLSRLVPLVSQENLVMNVPTVLSKSDNSDAASSMLYRLLLQLCGVAIVDNDQGLDTDILSVYEYEIEDMTNEVINYCRGNGPFRVSTVKDSTLGFFGLNIGRK